MKVIIVGGVAGGASCAARLRRLDEKAEILMVERGPYVSYANCGLPYHVGGSIEEESSLLVATEQMFRAIFTIDCRTNCEVVGISAKKKTVELKNRISGEITTEKYDKLLLSPGSAPIRPPLPGIDLPGIFSVRTVPDARNIREWLDRDVDRFAGESFTALDTVSKPKRAVVIGGGFIGLEMVENLVHRGLDVTLIEKLNQVMPPLDTEMARIVERYLSKHGVKVELGDGVAGFRKVEKRFTGSSHGFRQSASGRHRCFSDRRASGDRTGQDGRNRDRETVEEYALMNTCAHPTPISWPSAMPSKSKISLPGNGRSSLWPGLQTVRVVSRPM